MAEIPTMGELKVKNDVWLFKYKAITDGLFRKLYALILTVGAGYFLWEAAFQKEEASQVMLIGVGFVTNAVITVLISFFFGTSQSSQDKEKKGDE